MNDMTQAAPASKPKPKAAAEKPKSDDTELDQLRAELAALRDKVDRLTK